jgi:two-component system sensor histidine kinase KdpD
MLRRSSIVEDRESADLISIIIDESERLNRFINGLFDITKLESGATMPNIARHDIAEVVGSALHRGAKIIADHHIEVELASGLQTVDLDAVLFEQVLFNLLDNAAKYSPKGTAITIRGRRDTDSICLEVLDEGNGIPLADLERIFNKFYRVEKHSQQCPGTGLGLAIARGFIEAMHGTITATNRMGGASGAVFVITLPCRR